MASTRKLPAGKPLFERVAAVLGRHVRRGDRLVAGLSGGIDSVVMLDLLLRASKKMRFELAALHVNHQINPAAAKWARFCRAVCRELAVPLTVVKVQVRREASLEGAARKARYAAFAQLPADFVALAHNIDDQAETLLLQLFRGAGVKGVSAMPVLRVGDRGFKLRDESEGSSKLKQSPSLNPVVLRPLLDVSRAEIEVYAASRQLKWVDDDSNADTVFDRNFVRHRLLPVIAERYPAYRKTLARASRNFAEAADLLDELAHIDVDSASPRLKIAAVRALSPARAKNALRFFLAGHGVTMPNEARLTECVRQVQVARATRLVIDHGEVQLRGFNGELQLVSKAAQTELNLCCPWRGEARLQVTELCATLVMQKSLGAGISLEKLRSAPVTVRLRQGGVYMRVDARRPRRSLKNLLQEARLPPWLRNRLPLLFCGESIVYVPGIGIDESFIAKSGEPAVEPHWEPHSKPLTKRA